MLDARRMQVLRAVITSGSVTAAARNLGYTPSAISQQLSTLEREAGVALLERAGRGIRPTAAGTLLAEHAELVGAQLSKAEAALNDLKAGRTGSLSIRYFSTAGASLMPRAVAAMRREHPGIGLDLKLIDPGDPMPEVESGKADLAIVVLHKGATPAREVELVHLLDDPHRVVLPKGHRLARKRVIDLGELADEPWVGNEYPRGACSAILFDACAAAGFTPDMAVESEDYRTAQGFVAAGLGISVIPELGVGGPYPGVVVRKLRRPEPVRSIHVAIAARARDRPAVRYLIDSLREAVRGTAAA
ncbi:LysR family transcriptional regulator [Amycolatopsis minnesotensis]|uniref:LysR family transcriptional regulator n=1 Tax=Amycolatopsis minnesotensis TaxID=337894 RepID=A0ABN2Q8R7_9PSEU